MFHSQRSPQTLSRAIRVGEEHIHVEVAVLVRRAPGDAPRDRHSDDARLTAEELDDTVEDALVLEGKELDSTADVQTRLR